MYLVSCRSSCVMYVVYVVYACDRWWRSKEIDSLHRHRKICWMTICGRYSSMTSWAVPSIGNIVLNLPHHFFFCAILSAHSAENRFFFFFSLSWTAAAAVNQWVQRIGHRQQQQQQINKFQASFVFKWWMMIDIHRYIYNFLHWFYSFISMLSRNI